MNLSEINQALGELNEWSLEASAITKNFIFEDFKKAMEFVNSVAEIAEKLNHHPDIMVSYNKVRLLLTTHSANALTKIDFDVAKEVDKLNAS